MVTYLLTDPAAPGLIPNIPEIFWEEKNVDVVEIIQWRCLEESSGQWIVNTDQNHIVLASGKLVYQKRLFSLLIPKQLSHICVDV